MERDDLDAARPRRLGDDRCAGATTPTFAELDPLPDGLIAPMGGLWTDGRRPGSLDRPGWTTPSRRATTPDHGPLSRASRREMQQPQRYTGMTTVRGVRSSSSYGFGLRVFDEPDLGTVVTHSGGLPGYGSNMRWMPGRRVGAIALANTTYAPMTELTARLARRVGRRRGSCPRPRRPVSAEVDDLGRGWSPARTTGTTRRPNGSFTRIARPGRRTSIVDAGGRRRLDAVGRTHDHVDRGADGGAGDRAVHRGDRVATRP